MTLCDANLYSFSVRDMFLRHNIGFAHYLPWSIAYELGMFCSVRCIPFPQTC